MAHLVLALSSRPLPPGGAAHAPPNTVIFTAALLAALLLTLPAAAQPHTHAAQPAAQPAAKSAAPARSAAPKDASVYIGWPMDGSVISPGPFKVWFGTRNFGVAPAGVTKGNTGHHHILVDTPAPKLDEPIPNDSQHLHFGLGQTETTLDLPPGRHTLQLLMGDADHVPHDPPVLSRRITITVRGPAR